MARPTTMRIAFCSAIFAGATLSNCPVVTAAALGAAVVSVIGSHASKLVVGDIEKCLKQGRLTSLRNHDLQKLVGQGLAVLIEFYEKENAEPNFAQKLVPLLKRMRLKDARLCALAQAARTHWEKLDLRGESGSLQDARLHEAFADYDRTSGEPYVAVEEWERHLSDLTQYAATPPDRVLVLRDADRRALAEYIAPRFAATIRELVKADLDPETRTGGRTFIALHLDLMHVITTSLRKMGAKSDEQLEQLSALNRGFEALRTEISTKLDAAQHRQFGDLLLQVCDELRRSRDELTTHVDALHGKVDAIDSKLLDIANQLTRRRRGMSSGSSVSARVRDGVAERYDISYVGINELTALRDFAVRHMGAGIADESVLRSWFQVNPRIFSCLRYLTEDGGWTAERLFGYFSLRPITGQAVRLLEAAKLDGASLLPAHIMPLSRRTPSAVYIGGVAADRVARGPLLVFLKAEVRRWREAGVRKFYSKPVTDDGQRLLDQYGFSRVVARDGSSRNVYRLIVDC